MANNTQCPNCKKLARELADLRQEYTALKKRFEALEAELRRGKRQAAPFSREQAASERKRPGRQH